MIDRKFDNENDRQCVKMLLQKCMQQQLTRYMFLYDNFLALTQMEINYQKPKIFMRLCFQNIFWQQLVRYTKQILGRFSLQRMDQQH